MKWVAWCIGWASLAWGSGTTTLPSSVNWSDCLIQVSRHDPSHFFPALYLRAQEERLLIGTLVGTREFGERVWYLGLADYIGSHEQIIATIGALHGKVEEVSYAGELRIENHTHDDGLGHIVEVGDASGYLYQKIKMQSRLGAKELEGTRYHNNVGLFIGLMKVLLPNVMRSDPFVTYFDRQPHLLLPDLGDLRHDFDGFLLQLTTLSNSPTPVPLGDTIEHYQRTIDTNLMREKIRWMVPHIIKELPVDRPSYGELPSLMDKWHAGTITKREWKRLSPQLHAFEHDAVLLGDRVLLIRL